MLSQAGLIDPNHPALNYGFAPDSGKIRLRDIMGEAWYNLRTGEGVTPYQYGMFGALVMFFVICTAGLFMFMASFALNIGQSAHAQIFHLPANNTDWTTANMGNATPAGMLIDMRPPCDGVMVPPACTTVSGDLAIMFLDRVLRQGADPGTGGNMQNAVASLLGAYSSGVLIVAAFVTSWAIFSVVTDTMRTGHLGGGRHNMLWAPIRFVFALGLLVPIGGGYNSGQIIVMKLAEFGSNLGSNGWRNYITGIATTSLIADLESTNVSWLVRDVGRIMTCVAAYNAFQFNTSGVTALPVNATSDELWVRRLDSYAGGPYVQERNYGNELNKNMCGTVTFMLPDDPSISSADPTDVFKRRMRTAFMNGYQAMIPNAVNLGCEISSEVVEPSGFPGNTCRGGQRVESNSTFSGGPAARVPIGTSGNRALLNLPAGSPALGACGDGVAGSGGVKANLVCPTNMLNAWNGIVLPEMAAARTDLVNNFANPGTPYARLITQGWAAMGIWYHEIGRLNREMQQASIPPITAKSQGAIEAEEFDNCNIWDVVGTPFGAGGCVQDDHAIKVLQSVQAYDKWWSDSPTLVGMVRAPGSSPGSAGEAGVLENGEVNSDLDFEDFTSMDSLLGALFGANDSGYFLYKLAGYAVAPNPPYPMAQVAHIGETMYERSLYTYTAIMIAGVVGGAFGVPWEAFFPGLGGAAIAVLSGPVGDMLLMLAQMMFLPGVMLMFYVPLIPWVRVTFAALGWIMSVFEAAAMVPIFALAHLRTDGPGLMGRQAAGAWMMMLHLLFRPVLVVIGYVGAILLFNTGAQFVGDTLSQTIPSAQPGSGMGVFDRIFNTVIYVGMIYTLANTVFKMVDIIPAAAMNWVQFEGGRRADGSNPFGGLDGSMGVMAAAGIGAKVGTMSRSVAMTSGVGMGRAMGRSVDKTQAYLRGFGRPSSVNMSMDPFSLTPTDRKNLMKYGSNKLSKEDKEKYVARFKQIQNELSTGAHMGTLTKSQEKKLVSEMNTLLDKFGKGEGFSEFNTFMKYGF